MIDKTSYMSKEDRASLRHFLSAAIIFGNKETDVRTKTLNAFDEWFALGDAESSALCSPTMTECPRCKNDISRCDGIIANPAVSTNPTEPDPTTKPVAYLVLWGILEMRPHYPAYQTLELAKDAASYIKSKTEIWALYLGSAAVKTET